MVDETLDLLKKYRSRKWMLTLSILVVACLFAGFDKLSGELSSVLTGLGVSYNGFQGLIDWQKARNGK